MDQRTLPPERPEIPDGLSVAPHRGSFDGSWHTEESPFASRLGIHVTERLHEERSSLQKITVYDSGFFGRVLTLDDIVMFTERDEFVYHEMLVHVPLCSIPDPRSVLLIGGGDCGCLREVLKHSCIESVVQCEIDERVTRVCENWFPWVREAISDPRVELVFDDAVRYIEKQNDAFDLVIVDSTDPTDAAVGLFLSDFYKKVARGLRRGGVMTAQTESPHWDSQLVPTLYAQIRQAFSCVSTYLGGVPTYPSGTWSWAYASMERRPHDYLDRTRSESVCASCRYYNSELHHAAFVLPNFVRRLLAGENPFERFDENHRRIRGE